MKITVTYTIPARFGKRTPEVAYNLLRGSLDYALAHRKALGPKKVYGVLEEKNIKLTHNKLLTMLRAMHRTIEVI